MVFSFKAQVHAGGQGLGRPLARHLARQVGQVQGRGLGHGFRARQGQQLVHQVGAALRAAQDLAQPRLQRGVLGFALGQFHLADEAGQGRAQLVRGVVQKAFFLFHAAVDLTQQAVDGLHQGVHLAGGLGHADGLQSVDRAVLQLCCQARERQQAPANAGVDHQAEHHAQRQERREHVPHQLSGDAVLGRQAFAHLHAQGLGLVGVAIRQIERDDAHGLVVERSAVQQRCVEHHVGGSGLGQGDVAQQKLPRW